MAIDFNKKQKTEIPTETLLNIGAAVLGVALLITLWLITINPQQAKTAKTKKRISSIAKIDQAAIYKARREKNKLAEERDELSEKVVGIKTQLRKEKNISTLLDQLIRTAKAKDLEFTYIKPLKETTNEIEQENIVITFKEVPVSMELKAGFAEFLSFLKDTEKVEDIIKITELKISATSDISELIQKLTYSVYQLEEQKEVKDKNKK